ncbi:MAG: hypothetical protein AAFQ79_14895 [Pseudomonadota bacterium]
MQHHKQSDQAYRRTGCVAEDLEEWRNDVVDFIDNLVLSKISLWIILLIQQVLQFFSN